ncbi:MAG: hypothetical protein IJC49_04865 [Clostridia bacterium]|nr:hypothetical protein [Clostridia bacterium]
MAKKKRTNAAELREKRRVKLENQKKKTDIIAYVIAGVTAAVMIAILIISLI